MSKRDPEDVIVRLREELEEAVAQRDAGRRLLARIEKSRAEARERAKETRQALFERYERCEKVARDRKAQIGEEKARVVALERDLGAARAEGKQLSEQNARLLTEVSVLAKRAGLEGVDLKGSKLSVDGAMIHFRASVLATCARLGIAPVFPPATPLRSKEQPTLLGVSLANDDAYVRAIFTIEERVGRILDAAKRVVDSFPPGVAEKSTGDGVSDLHALVYGRES